MRCFIKKKGEKGFMWCIRSSDFAFLGSAYMPVREKGPGRCFNMADVKNEGEGEGPR